MKYKKFIIRNIKNLTNKTFFNIKFKKIINNYLLNLSINTLHLKTNIMLKK